MVKALAMAVTLRKHSNRLLLSNPTMTIGSRACSVDGASPHVERFASFDAYLDNKDALETIPVQAQMIIDALSDL